MDRTFTCFTDINQLNDTAAQLWAEACQQAVAQKGFFSIALAGGSTPKGLYELMAREYGHLPWQQHHIFFGDERSVPLDHPDSNYAMAKTALLDKVAVKYVYPMLAEAHQMQQGAQSYQQQLHQLYPETAVPNLDLVLLGMGDDGHTASLFPHTRVLQEQTRLVAEVYVDKLKTWRLTMTYPLLNAAQTVLFLVAGENKAGVVQAIVEQSADYPSARVKARKVQWLLDSAAAAKLRTPGGVF